MPVLGSPCGTQTGPLPAADGKEALSAKEIRLVQLLNLYRGKLAEACENFSPAVMANYSYDLAKEFNQYYHDTQILKESNEQVRNMRLTLINAVAQVLAHSMGLLGIELPERM